MKKTLRTKGFTLVEAMVAISILSLAVTGPLLIAQKGIQSAIYSRDQVTAYYLAQEAIEYVRNVRDTNRLSQAPWLNGLNACLQSVAGTEKCSIDARFPDFATTGAITACPLGACPAISLDKASGLYGYNIGAPTMFTREVSINTLGDTANSPAKEAKISVTIKWSTGLFVPLKTFTVNEVIFNF